LDKLGFEIIEGVLSSQEAERLVSLLDSQKIAPLRGGIRRIEQLVPAVAVLAQSSRLLAIAKLHILGQPHLVRAIYFDKSPENNWFVTWHQDRTVAVSERFEKAGWEPWSLKAGAWHVQPPIEVLESMITIRVHLDAATADNGCLKIAPGSHRLGLLASEAVLEYVDRNQVVFCETPVGGAVVMRPHALHASEKSRSNAARRVLHFEYCSFQLPDGITWAT
jgi:ectoine hydroxylase-related dioxygenase (phytanoyl-CoA dioxygenase family)